MKVTESCPTLCDPMDYIGQNTGVSSLSLLQGIFPNQGSNPDLLHCRQILYQLSHRGSPIILERVAYPFSRGSSQSRNLTGISCIAGGFFTNWAISSVQFSHVWLFATPGTTARQASLSITNSQSPPKPMSIESVMPSNLSSIVPFSSCPQSFPASGSFPMSQLFTSGGQRIGVSASTSVLPMNTQDWLISFRMDWLDLLAVQGTCKSLFQHHSSKASILQHSTFLIVQLSHPYMITGKTIAWTRRTFVGKVMSLLFNMLSRLVITFLPRTELSGKP